MSYYKRTHYYPANEADAIVVYTGHEYVVTRAGVELARFRGLDSAYRYVETLTGKAQAAAA